MSYNSKHELKEIVGDSTDNINDSVHLGERKIEHRGYNPSSPLA
jgi:hypothetical protein